MATKLCQNLIGRLGSFFARATKPGTFLLSPLLKSSLLGSLGFRPRFSILSEIRLVEYGTTRPKMLFGEWEMLFGEWEMLSGEWETWAFGGPLWGHIGFIRDHSGLTAGIQRLWLLVLSGSCVPEICS